MMINIYIYTDYFTIVSDIDISVPIIFSIW